MEFRLAYGRAEITLEVPDRVTVDTFYPAASPRPITFDDFAREMDRSAPAWLKNTQPGLFIVNDGYRNTPTSRVLDWLEQYRPGVLAQAEFLIATGTHPAPEESHLKQIFGDHLNSVRARVEWHDCRDQASMVEVGRDHFDQPFFLNKKVTESENLCVIGSVEPHYFAGYTGGRKSIFPGLTDLATVERNHNLANSLECQPLRLDGNPLCEHLEELTRLSELNDTFSIQAVLDVNDQFAACACGSLSDAFSRAVDVAHDVYAHVVEQPYDVVLAEIAPPLDANVYQAQKALENTQMVVKDGGAAVVVSECAEGVGSKYFFEQAKDWDREKNVAGDGIARFGSHKLSRVNLMTRRILVGLHSQADPDQVRQVFYSPIEDLQNLLNDRLSADGVRLAVVHNAGHTVLNTKTVL